MAKNLLELVYSAIDELNQQLPPQKRVAKSEATPLTGSTGALDSLGFLNLIVIVEDKVNAAHGSAIALASSMMESQLPPPRTIGELALLVSKQLDDAAHG